MLPIRWTKRHGLIFSSDGRFLIRRLRGERHRYVLFEGDRLEEKPLHWGGTLREVKATAERRAWSDTMTELRENRPPH